MDHTPNDMGERTQLAQFLLARGIDTADLEMHSHLAAPVAFEAKLALNIPFPSDRSPKPRMPDPLTKTNTPLPRADVLVITWTVDEQNALADVLTPGIGRKKWTRYDRYFKSRYAPLIRRGAPSLQAGRLGSWAVTTIGSKSVLCFKSELHLNQDGRPNANGPGYASLPVRQLLKQLIEEVKPEVVLTVGTSGGVFLDHDLGDVVVTRAAKFRLTQEFKNAPFNGQVFKNDWLIPQTFLSTATELMQPFASNLIEPTLFAPTARHSGRPFTAPTYIPDIVQDGQRGIPAFHPILTTDYFEYGTSTNHLEQDGLAVEMGDAVLGLVASEMPDPPHWAVVRNLSDPQINGELDESLQVQYAVWYYTQFGYWTSVMSALATWGIIAGLS